MIKTEPAAQGGTDPETLWGGCTWYNNRPIALNLFFNGWLANNGTPYLDFSLMWETHVDLTSSAHPLHRLYWAIPVNEDGR